MARLKLRVLEEYLQELDVFESPKIHLEQYVTQPHIASHLLHAAQTTFSDLEGCSVADLGCGCGALALGSAALGASYVVGFEVDIDAVKVFYKNAKKLGLTGQWDTSHQKHIETKNVPCLSKWRKQSGVDEIASDTSSEEEKSEDEDNACKGFSNDGAESSDDSFEGCKLLSNLAVDVVLLDVTSGEGLGSANCRWHKAFDTVVMNPPFGTKNNHGADMAFLKSALGMARRAVYSLHKTSTRNYVLAKGKEWGGPCTTAEVLARLRFDLPKSYKFHHKRNVDVEVDFVRFGLSNSKNFDCSFSKRSSKPTS